MISYHLGQSLNRFLQPMKGSQGELRITKIVNYYFFYGFNCQHVGEIESRRQ